MTTWKEIKPYWSKVSNIITNDDAITQFVSKRIRGKPTAPPRRIRCSRVSRQTEPSEPSWR